ncbi:MAG: hypothetical protein IPG39_12690 [Bacteroidetes bacterium]|nr:hypothetical protein [Bacteroidota bacterium]
MKLLTHPLFIGSVVLFVLNQLMEHSGIFVPLIYSYLDDLLFMPIVLTLSLLLQRRILGWKYRLNTIHLLFGFVYVSVVMEAVLPLMNDRFISDPFDVLMYGFGIILFQMLLNKPSVFDDATVSFH